jgi:predicted DNA-binding transcriptional regulator AlpA
MIRVATADPATLARWSNALEARPQADAQSVRLFSITQAARESGLSRNSLYRMMAAGSLRAVEIRPGCRRIPQAELLRLAKGGAASE